MLIRIFIQQLQLKNKKSHKIIRMHINYKSSIKPINLLLLWACIYLQVAKGQIITTSQDNNHINRHYRNGDMLGYANLRGTNKILEQINRDVHGELYRVGQTKDGLGAELVGFVFGPIAFLLSFVMIWYNQKRAAINKKRILLVQTLLNQPQPQQLVHPQLQSLESPLQSVPQPPLVHLSGPPTIHSQPKDSITGLTIPKTLKLCRHVEVREYRKISSKRDDEPELGWYSYHDAEGGGRHNQAAWWFLKAEDFVGQASLAGYDMNQGEILGLAANGVWIPTENIAMAVVQYTKNTKTQWTIQGEYIYFPSTPGDNQSAGSLRLRYTYHKPQVLSIIASPTPSKALVPFKIAQYQNKGSPDTLCCQGQPICCACNAIGELMKPIADIDVVMEGQKTKEDMIQIMIGSNRVVTMGLRIAAFIVMVAGIVAFFNPIVSLLGWIPIVGGFIKGTAAGLIFAGALIVSIPLFLLCFSFAWLIYHPRMGIIIFAAAIAVVVIIVILDETGQKG